ncbi:hypothetical protein cyc_01881 [Cyclospora cayetanensis]|uniref:SET domain-containing protein n=1 Tax=Cyclospora cayetanensis TaxID=88456 RepID=A0A1D3D0P9_9EIME|nr:hypothetical protein cyc_01881 [Cyclospora cayetanensis]
MEGNKASRRVPYGRLCDFVGRRIRFVGKIKEAEDDAIIIEASEGRCVKCFFREPPPPCRYVEVVATVQEDLTVKQEDTDQTIPLGDNIEVTTPPCFLLQAVFRTAAALCLAGALRFRSVGYQSCAWRGTETPFLSPFVLSAPAVDPMEVDVGLTHHPPVKTAACSPNASQENDQAQANVAVAFRADEGAQGPPSVKPEEALVSECSSGCRKRKTGVGGVPPKTPFNCRSKARTTILSGSGGCCGGSSSKFVSAAAVLEEARKVKDSLPELSKDFLDSLLARGLEPVTLKEVLEERRLQWAATQVRDERAESEHARLLEAFQRQCEGWGNNREGWVHSKWHSVIVCPDFKRGGLQVSRSSMRDMWNSIMSVVHGFVNPDLLVCRVTDPTHPVRFATPPGESCYTVVYAGREPLRASRERKILGEYTGHVRAGSTNKQRFEYVFDLSFCALAWRAAEEFERESDSSGDEGIPAVPKISVPTCENAVDSSKATAATKNAAESASEGKRRVQVTGAHNIKRVALPVRGELVLDSHDACNQMSLVNHYGTIGLLGDRICHCNTEWQQVFVDGWPHVVLTTIPGVAIEPGDEVLADFGYDWFNRVQDASHKAIARELLDYRIGAKTGGYQTLAPARSADCVVRDSDATLQTRARMGEVCPYCHSDEIPVVSSSAARSPVKAAPNSSKAAVGKQQDTAEGRLETRAQDFGELTENATETAPRWGEQQKASDDPQSAIGTSSVSVPESREAALPAGGFGLITGGETVEDVCRWFVEGDCKWYCCICRLQWERMAAAMNFSVDWTARRVLGDGNPLLLRSPSDSIAEVRAAAPGLLRSKEEQQEVKDNSTGTHNSDPSASITKRRPSALRRGSISALLSKRQRKAPKTSPHFTRSSKGLVNAFGEQGASSCGPLPVPKGEEGSAQELDGSASRGNTEASEAVIGGRTGSEGALAIHSADTGTSACETVEGKSTSSKEVSETPLLEVKPGFPGDVVAGLSTGVPESPLSGADSDVPLKTANLCVEPAVDLSGEGAAMDACSTGNEEATATEVAVGGEAANTTEAGAERKSSGGFVVQEPMRVYKDSREKCKESKMQPCPVAVTVSELSSEELLGCRTEMLVEPRTLLGSLQPCVRCYKLYGAKASVEVCRLTKRHLASNWDHPHFASPAQIQDALLTCFQDALLTVQREHREKLQQVLEGMNPLQRKASMNALLAGTRQPRIHATAARRSAEDPQGPEVHASEVLTKGSIPLISVTLGKTRVDCKYRDPENPKKLKWYYGCVTEYQAVAPEFRIDYDDGDTETVPPHELIEMLIATGPGSKLDGRKAITTTPLVKMLSPDMKKANRQVTHLVRQTNRKMGSVESGSESDGE